MGYEKEGPCMLWKDEAIQFLTLALDEIKFLKPETFTGISQKCKYFSN